MSLGFSQMSKLEIHFKASKSLQCGVFLRITEILHLISNMETVGIIQENKKIYSLQMPHEPWMKPKCRSEDTLQKVSLQRLTKDMGSQKREKVNRDIFF